MIAAFQNVLSPNCAGVGIGGSAGVLDPFLQQLPVLVVIIVLLWLRHAVGHELAPGNITAIRAAGAPPSSPPGVNVWAGLPEPPTRRNCWFHQGSDPDVPRARRDAAVLGNCWMVRLPSWALRRRRSRKRPWIPLIETGARVFEGVSQC